MAVFLAVYFRPENQEYSWLFGLLTVSVAFKLLRLLHEWYHYWKVIPSTPPPLTRTWTIDVLTTYCPGEPKGMVINTLKAIQRLPYPHTTYLCDEADDPSLKQVCVDLGVRHVTRVEKSKAKAGNINNALREATGEICLVIDPDHIPVPDFIDHVLPYFEDPDIGFVQCAQGYYNRNESIVAYGAAEQTYSFYGPMMTCMGNYGTAQAIGANCMFRRAALDSIGGHADGLSEDMHTAMQLHAKGWKSAYVPLPLSYGLVPATLSAYYKQQLKWSRGTFELLFITYPKLFSRFTLRQRFHYGTLPLYYLVGCIQLIDLLIPIASLVLMRLPLQLDLLLFGSVYIPLLLTSFLIRQYAQRWLIERHEIGFHLIGGILASGTWWVYVLGLLYTIFRVKVPYIPTPKDDRPQNNFLLVLPNILMCLLTLGAIGFSVYWYGRFTVHNVYAHLMIGFGLLNALILSLNVLIGQEKVVLWLRNLLSRLALNHPLFFRTIRVTFWSSLYGFYYRLRSSTILVFGGVLVLTVGILFFSHYKKMASYRQDLRYANTQSFYFGLTSGPAPQPSTIASSVPIVPYHLTWPTNAHSVIRETHWSDKTSQIPLLYIEPGTAQATGDVNVKSFLRSILKGELDTVLNRFSQDVKGYGRPVMASFMPEFDNLNKPWGVGQEESLILCRRAWQYIVHFCRAQQADNVAWVWCPSIPYTLATHYPGDEYVDWLGFSVIDNPLVSSDHKRHSFAAHFQVPYKTVRMHESYSIRQKPILITSLGSEAGGEEAQHWETEAINIIQERYPEIRGIMFADQSHLRADIIQTMNMQSSR
ncbi:hypothetical protein GCM10028819_43630 [Spirosoma humi]